MKRDTQPDENFQWDMTVIILIVLVVAVVLLLSRGLNGDEIHGVDSKINQSSRWTPSCSAFKLWDTRKGGGTYGLTCDLHAISGMAARRKNRSRARRSSYRPRV